MEKEPLLSVQMSTGTRVYYFDAHKDRKGKFYLAISEIPTDKKPGRKRRSKLFVHSNNLAHFVESLEKITDSIKMASGDE